MAEFVEYLYSLMNFVEWIGWKLFGLVHGKDVEGFVFVFTLMTALMFATVTFEAFLRSLKWFLSKLIGVSMVKAKDIGAAIYRSIMRVLSSAKVVLATITLLLCISWVIGSFFSQVSLPTKEHFQSHSVQIAKTEADSNLGTSKVSDVKATALEVENSTRQALGQMGDFFGGMLNPILAFASFIALLYTIKIQSEELRLTRKEFEKSVAVQERMATEAEKQLSRQILLEDYRHIANKLRAETATLNELLKKTIAPKAFPLGSTPPANISELISKLHHSFYSNSNGQANDADSCFARARKYYSDSCEPKSGVQAVEYFNDELNGYLNPFLDSAMQLVGTIETHTEIYKAVELITVQRKIIESDARSAIEVIVYAYILKRTFKRVSPHYSYSLFIPKDPERMTVFKEILSNLGLPTKAIETL